MRTKKRPTLAAPDLTAAWEQFYQSTKEDDLDALATEGWKSMNQMVEESGKPLPTITSRMKSLVQKKVFDRKIVRALTGQGVREIALYRPIPTALTAVVKTTPAPAGLASAVQSIAARHPHLTPSGVREYLPKGLRASCKAADIAAILGK